MSLTGYRMQAAKPKDFDRVSDCSARFRPRKTVATAGRSYGGPSEKFVRGFGGHFQKLPPDFSEVAFMWKSPDATHLGATSFGNGPNTVSESTVSNTELSEFFGAHRVPGRELSEFLSAYYLCAKANSPSLSQNSPSLPQNSVRLSEFSPPKKHSRNSTITHKMITEPNFIIFELFSVIPAL